MNIENNHPPALITKIRSIFHEYLILSKAGIVLFALISAAAGYVFALQHPSRNMETTDLVRNAAATIYYHSHPYSSSVAVNSNEIISGFSNLTVLFLLLLGLWLVISGSFAINQSMEWPLDRLMKRTCRRPVPAGKITATQAFALGTVQIVCGLFILLMLKPLTAGLAVLAIALYNIFYTIFWKKNWIFAAVPGAVPGALPVMIGYSAASSAIFSIECLYLFFILFLWQMPHFWALALHYKEDYRAAGIPVLPVSLGSKVTISYIGIYLLSYLGMVLISPLLFKMNILYVICLIPLCIKLFIEFIKFSKCLNWLPFFLWLNVSVLVFLWVPIGDLWLYSLI